MVAHFCLKRGDFIDDVWRASQSIDVCISLFSVFILSHLESRGGSYMPLSILSIRLVEIFYA